MVNKGNIRTATYTMVRHNDDRMASNKCFMATTGYTGTIRGTQAYIRWKLGEIANYCKNTGFRLNYTIEV